MAWAHTRSLSGGLYKLVSRNRLHQNPFAWATSRKRGATQQPTKPQIRSNDAFAEITMSNSRLPAETLDHVVDHLPTTKDALRNCCLVSKLWVPRARKRLFANVALNPTAGSPQPWKEMPQILQYLLGVTPEPYPLILPRSSSLQMRERVVESKTFLALCTRS
jgi:hypothetical protein